MVNTSGNNDSNQVTTPVTPTPVQPVNSQVTQDTVSTPTPEDLDSQWTRWKCSVCNYTYEGRNPIKKCPRCGNEDPDKFIDAD